MNALKRFILKALFKREVDNLFWAFQDVANQVEKLHLQRRNRERLDKSISNYRQMYIRLFEKKKSSCKDKQTATRN